MSAPKDARRLDAYASKEEKKENQEEKVKCSCGWKGHLGQLLVSDDEETMWCPQCRTSGWEFD